MLVCENAKRWSLGIYWKVSFFSVFGRNLFQIYTDNESTFQEFSSRLIIIAKHCRSTLLSAIVIGENLTLDLHDFFANRLTMMLCLDAMAQFRESLALDTNKFINTIMNMQNSTK